MQTQWPHAWCQQKWPPSQEEMASAAKEEKASSIQTLGFNKSGRKEENKRPRKRRRRRKGEEKCFQTCLMLSFLQLFLLSTHTSVYISHYRVYVHARVYL